MVYYLNPVNAGIDAVTNLGDGSTINVRWFKAYPTTKTNGIAYNIYYSTIKENVYSEGIKFVSVDGSLEQNIIDLIPGQLYFFSVRPIEYDPSFDINQLPVIYDNLRIYPSSILSQNIIDTDLVIPLLDVTGFPNSGVVKVGYELIQYSSINLNDLVLTDLSQRGYSGTNARSHDTSGYDGYGVRDTNISLFLETEGTNFDRVFACQARFEYPNHAFTLLDGYRQTTKDLLSTDLAASDEENIGFPMYDYAGYHRIDPVKLLSGECVGSYIGGEYGCIDKYGNNNIVRGLNLQDKNNQRQEIELSVTGRVAVLIKRVHTGIQCSCYLASSEYPDDRCPICLGTKFVVGWEQFFNPRRSDGRILVRAAQTDENLKMYEAGLESEFPISFWTLTTPTIKTRDIVILFDIDDNEEFRYEVTTVTRNNTILGQQGGQLFRGVRVRKFDPAYQIRAFSNTSMYPSKLLTGIGMAIPGLPPHTHSIIISEKITLSQQINQITSIDYGHSHVVVDGKIIDVLDHSHTILYP